MKSIMAIYLFCFALLFVEVLSDRPIKLQVVERAKCVVTASESAKKDFHNALENEEKVFYFEVYYTSQLANNLTRPIPGDHFANPNKFMWLYDGENGLPIFMNAPYDFDVLSLFILHTYTKKLKVHMDVSESCKASNVSRVQFLHLVFQQINEIVAKAPLPDNKASAYICYDINNSKKLSARTVLAFTQLGMNREILKRFCCQMKNIQPNVYNGSDLCPGNETNVSNTLDLQNYVGAFLFAFLPLLIGFIAEAKMPWTHSRFAHICSISENFDKKEQFVLPFGTEACWISEYNNSYKISSFLKWIFLFHNPTFIASRIRRSMAVISSLSILVFTLLLHLYMIKEELKIYMDDRIPLGFVSVIFGYHASGENTDYFLGGPYVWFSAFEIVGLILINIPNRLSETIAYSFLHQPRTCTFLIQDVDLLKRYGSLNVSNLRDYDLLYAILKASLLTSLNPSFWYAVINQWFHRCKKVYNCFDNRQIFYQLIGVCVLIPCVFISGCLCAIELLVCVLFYACPMLLVSKAIPHSYIWRFIWPFFRETNFVQKIVGFLLLLISLPVFLFLFLFTAYLFLTGFQLLSSYVMYTVIALIAKPDAIGYILLSLVFLRLMIWIIQSISETYQSLLKVSITLTENVCKRFVYTRLGERFIYADLFERIVKWHHPVRYEIAKALSKLLLAISAYVSCVYSFQNINLNLSTYIKFALIILTTIFPMVTNALNDTVVDSRWKSELLLEIIYDYKRESDDPFHGNRFSNL